MRLVSILIRENNAAIASRIECADTSLRRLVGLLGRSSLSAGEGIWIQPSSGIHTFGMKFPIDVVGLDREMRILKLWRQVKPQRMTSVSTKVNSVLELAGGEIDAHSLHVGQELYAIPAQNNR
jgi:hypothetical protein